MNKKVNSFLLSRDYYYRVMDEDLWPEILKRLPIKIIFRFRSVCKWWNSLISSAFFINLYFSFTYATMPRNLKPYLHVTYGVKPGHHKSYDLFRPHKDIEHLYCPFRAPREDALAAFSFVDTIHGVVCISYSSCSTYHVPSPSFNSTFLWNPSIHKYVTLPRLSLACHFSTIGFGYDASNNDFKVIQIDKSGMHRVYSALQGSWRPPLTTTSGIDLKHWRFGIRCDRTGCFVNGTIHWILFLDQRTQRIDDDGRFSVLMFDCESEELRIIDIPEKLFGVYFLNYNVKLLEYAGMLAALVARGGRLDPIDLWVMEEHGVSTSWKKLYMMQEFDWELHWDDDDDDDYEFGWTVTTYDPSFEKLVPYGPNNRWIKCSDRNVKKYRDILSDHVYEETMFLMDHPQAQSYRKKEIVRVSTEDDPVPITS